MEYRMERDSMGEIRVPRESLWGAQTQRSLEHFSIGTERMPAEIIRAFAFLKKAAAAANAAMGVLSEEKARWISRACDEILSGALDGEFPLLVWQTGSGTQSNMNVNEVIANWVNAGAGKKLLHPNDDVNRSQSSNDTFPAAMHVAALCALEDRLLPALERFEGTLLFLEEENRGLIKIGRTHLQDAVPLTFSQEISGWRAMIQRCRVMITASLSGLGEIALGATAVGTGINAPEGFGDCAAKELSAMLCKTFVSADNKFHALTAKDALVFSHGALKALAADLIKIANDVRWLASGPRAGIGEILIPENEPGSSIMPGKVNPTQCEALTMVCCQVIGNDVAVGYAASQGNFQLNVYMPVLIYNFLQSANLLTDAVCSFERHCVRGIRPNAGVMRRNLENSLMLVTMLSPFIGYDSAARAAKLAHEKSMTLKDAVLELGLMDEGTFDSVMRPENMV